MAWSIPMTAVNNARLFAADWNKYVRDNQNEFARAKTATPHANRSRTIRTAGIKSVEPIALVENIEPSAVVGFTTSSTSYVDTGGSCGLSGDLPTGVAKTAFIWFMVEATIDTANSAGIIAVGVGGPPSNDNRSVIIDGVAANKKISRSGFSIITIPSAESNPDIKLYAKVGNPAVTLTLNDESIFAMVF